MATIEKQIEQTLEKEGKKRGNDADFSRKRHYLNGIKESGLLFPKKYVISPLDTVGKRRYQSKKA